MLPDSKIAMLIRSQLPGISFPANGQPAGKVAVSKVINAFADYTGRMIRSGSLGEVKHCFTMAGVLYKNGSSTLRNAIEGVFVYALSPLLLKKHQALLPLALRNVRIQQLQTI
jgi:hypothetical protein